MRYETVMAQQHTLSLELRTVMHSQLSITAVQAPVGVVIVVLQLHGIVNIPILKRDLEFPREMRLNL